MLFDEIHPFVRYVHYLPLDKNAHYAPTIPYDARLFFCYNGSGLIRVKDTVYQMESENILLIPSGMSYHLYTPEYKVIYIAVNFDYTLENVDKKQPIPPAEQSLYNPIQRLEHIQFHDNLAFNDVIYLKKAGRLSNRLLRLEQEYSQKFLYYERLSSNILAEVLFECARMLSSQKYSYNHESIAKVIGYIHENYRQEITNQEIGKMLDLHPNYVNSIFKSFTGIPLHQYVLRVRISHAIELLLTGELSIGEIAINCGFCDIYHFSKCFKKAVGVTPSKYRTNRL